MIFNIFHKRIILSFFLLTLVLPLFANKSNISIDDELISLCGKISKEYKDGTDINIEKTTELIKELLVVTDSYRDSTLYTFSQVHEIPNYQNILQIEKVALKILSELEQNKTENISNLFMELQNAIINYLSQINSDFTYSSKILTIVLLISVAFCVAIIWVSLSHVKTTKEKNILKDKVLENEFITKTIVQVQEKERERISRDLHDTVLQDIRAEQLFLDKLKKIISSKEKDEELENILEQIISSGKSSLKNTSMIVKNLVPPEVEMEDFMRSLNDLVHNFQNTREIQCSFYTNSNVLLKKLDIEQKTHIYRIVQEAMTNAAKHANPTEIKVVVREDLENNLINFFITDDGCGFNNKTVKEIGIEKSTKLGLKGMESRAILLNGNLQIQSDEETGTHIKLVVPVN
ncbi:MAG: hypothetical protein E7064_07555 [Spirochaetaceae bacterium]|nr:hypothetical protein [Spirochaetaceae bacterium]